MNRREVSEWTAFRAATEGTPWQDVVAGWRAHLKTTGLEPCTTTVAEHVKVYLDELTERADRNEVSRGTLSHHRSKLKTFAEDFGSRRISDISTNNIKAWLAAQEEAHLRFRGSAMQPGTWNNYRKIVAVFFAHVVVAKLRLDNPVSPISERAEHKDPVNILTVPQIAHLFHFANTYRDSSGATPYRIGLRRLALEMFAGVRFSSACRLLPEDINTADRGIRHPSASIKTRRRQYIEGYPDNLWEWLAIAPDDAALCYTDEMGRENRERRYLALKSNLFVVARVPHLHNCMRHSFPTYHLASRTNPGQTAYLLCHRNQQKLWDYYKGNATMAEGKRFEQITPQTAEALASEWREELRRREQPLATVVPLPLPS